MLRIMNGEFIQDPHGVVSDAVYGAQLQPREIEDIHDMTETIYQGAGTLAEKGRHMVGVLEAADVRVIPAGQVLDLTLEEQLTPSVLPAAAQRA